jgi:putative component of membrane protein insertase Oxa1/YidC/SpoIIIJ protein YidD
MKLPPHVPACSEHAVLQKHEVQIGTNKECYNMLKCTPLLEKPRSCELSVAP